MMRGRRSSPWGFASMTRLTLEMLPDRRRTSRQLRADWGQYWTPDVDAMLAQIGDQMQRELQARVSAVAATVHSDADPNQVRVDVNPLPINYTSWKNTAHTAAALAVVEAPLVPAHIRIAAEKVAVWNRLYVVQER